MIAESTFKTYNLEDMKMAQEHYGSPLTNPDLLEDKVEVSLTGEELKWLSRMLDRFPLDKDGLLTVEGEVMDRKTLWSIDDQVRSAVIGLIIKHDK